MCKHLRLEKLAYLIEGHASTAKESGTILTGFPLKRDGLEREKRMKWAWLEALSLILKLHL
uniref:Uncharacterized protein n=1 Tax=Utricularia reniformis TaxID=192314 RepID=A0A1Y0AZ83_9LAMI|nr:hypothetical protein AEK19_MT0206 [Utricularia reniformis]ART30485.1 hypothetical protein AEK19_MT0206 [Utricularia reniformis]